MLEQEGALGEGLADELRRALDQVAQSAVHQLGRPATRSRCKVARLDQCDLVPAQRRLERNTRARDAAAHDKQVEVLTLQAPDCLSPPGHAQVPQRISPPYGPLLGAALARPSGEGASPLHPRFISARGSAPCEHRWFHPGSAFRSERPRPGKCATSYCRGLAEQKMNP